MTETQTDAVRLTVRLAMTFLLLSLAVYDVRCRRVPNSIVQPLLIVSAVGALARLWQGLLGLEGAAIISLAWTACIVLCWLHAFGGGDMKLVMALIALAPDVRLIYLMLGGALSGLLLVLIVGEGRQGIQRLAALLATASQGLLPDRAEVSAAYHSRGRPITFAFCLAGVVYLWFFWIGA